ncbi:MAG: transcriptional regulator [Actinomycetota bacterium]|nr:transcriptional regulator [Actinomycetota bacterium]
MGEQAPGDRLETLLIDPTRLRLVATLAGAGEVEFGFVRDRVGLTDSALSKQLRTLADAGLIATRRSLTGARRRMWIQLTPSGRRVLAEHARALREIADGIAPEHHA